MNDSLTVGTTPASPASRQPLPPPPPEIAELYREIAAKSRHWAEAYDRYALHGLWILIGFFLPIDIIFVATVMYAARTRPGLETPLGPPVQSVVVFLLLNAILFAIVWYGLRRNRGLWDRVASGTFPPKRSTNGAFFEPATEKEIRKWLVAHGAANQEESSPGYPPSDLVRALTLLRLGQIFENIARKMANTQFIALVIFGWMGVGALAFFVGALDPEFPGFLLTLTIGPLVVLLLSGWLLHRAVREMERLSRQFAPLAIAGDRLEQAFWSRF